ncbi:MAG: NYN domain-containing protein, partial [Bauldia sp.]
MAAPIKSALLVDYDSLYRSLSGAGGEAAARLAPCAGLWVGAIESGQLIGPRGTERAVAPRRCYADPALLGSGQETFAAAGFALTDCAANENGTRSAGLAMAIDAIEALAEPSTCGEFIVLSTEGSLAPLLTRLRARGCRVAIYADATTAPSYRALADSILEIAPFAEFLLTHDAAAVALAAAQPERAEIEAFARRIHAATNIPLFSPKTFAELFHYLTEEIATNGYHFQTTAKTVADRLAESGRSVTRRQVVFIVKGLALKGHVFSTSDTPRRLGEVFQEQARYLLTNAGLSLDEEQERLLSAWILGRIAAAGQPPASRSRPLATPAATQPAEPTPPAAGPAERRAESEGREPEAGTL